MIGQRIIFSNLAFHIMYKKTEKYWTRRKITFLEIVFLVSFEEVKEISGPHGKEEIWKMHNSIDSVCFQQLQVLQRCLVSLTYALIYYKIIRDIKITNVEYSIFF